MKTELKKIINDFGDAFEKESDQSRNAYMASLDPGARTPDRGKFYSAEDREHFKKRCDDFRDKAQEVLDNATLKVHAEITKPPTTEAVNTVSMLRMRKNISEDEIDALLTKNRDNVQAYSAIREIAAEHGMKNFRPHPIGQTADQLKDLSSSVMKYISVPSAESGHIQGVYSSILDTMIDAVDID